MSRSIAVTVVGSDRPGIVAGISEALYELGCNLEDVTSTILRGHFAMVLVVRVPQEADPVDIRQRLEAIGGPLGVTVTASPLEDATLDVDPPTHMVSVYGADRPGIVFRVTERLRSRSVNITDLTSRMLGEDGQTVYALMLEVAAPAGEDVEADLADLREQLGVEVSVRPIEPDVF
jgi:glycine cleavage system transcriptional repressor